MVSLRTEVEKAIEELRHYLQAELVDVGVEKGVVRVRLRGVCVGCTSQMTLPLGVERFLKNKIPEIRRVEFV